MSNGLKAFWSDVHLTLVVLGPVSGVDGTAVCVSLFQDNRGCTVGQN